MQPDKEQSLVEAFALLEESMKNEEEKFWESLTKEQQLLAFCAIVRRIKKGEIDDKGSYRYILYQVFGFDIDSYIRAQSAGYLELHNCIWTQEQLSKMKD